MRITVESAEVATLKADGRPWDGPGGVRLSGDELAAFFALDVEAQLDRLVQSGPPPVPPDVFVRLLADGQLLLETAPSKSFDPSWAGTAQRDVNLIPASPIQIQVWDRDVMFNDLIGELTISLPEGPGADGRWVLKPFGQVRKLVFRVA